MERKVWARTAGSRLYPNLYIILVGPPGIGKSAALSHAERLLREIPEIHVAPSSMTTASMIDTLNLAARKILQPVFVQFNSLQVIASELGVFLPSYDPAFMNTLTKLYDGELYEERRRTGKVNHIRIDYPQLSVLGGTTPSYLNSFLPDGAWDQGFTSRTIFVYCDEPVRQPLFADDDEENYDASLASDLISDLRDAAVLTGKVEFASDAKRAIESWNRKGLQPIPEHSRLTHYNTRRIAHCLKLCMVASAARGNSLEVTLEDFQTAQSWLLEAEAFMSEIFKGGSTSEARAIEDLYHFTLKLHRQLKRPIGEHKLIAFLRDRVPSFSIMKIIEMMCRSHMLKQELVNGVPHYVPLARE